MHPPTSNADLARRDLAVRWDPCARMQHPESLPRLRVRRDPGAWLEEHVGHRSRAAVQRQAANREHVVLADRTDERIVGRFERLVDETGESLDVACA